MGGGMVRTFESMTAKCTAAIALLLAISISLTSCSWPWASREASPSDEGPQVTVIFPESAGLKARVEPLDTRQEMEDVLPAGATLHKGVSLSMAEGSFPASGADVTFNLDKPLAADREGTIAYWNPEEAAWEPRATEISEDRRTLTARVEHFSDYNWIETFYNGMGKVLGDKTDPPTCSGGIPSWADPSFSKDNINAPVLWCIGTDDKNPDIMEVRLKMNRPSAGSVRTAIKPAWAWNDLWQNLAPQTWAQMAAQTAISSNQSGDEYLLQPLGEYRFGFNRAELMDFWSKNQDTPLIQVDSTLTYTLAGLMYQAAADKAAGNMAGVFIMTGLLECGGGLVGAAADKSVGGAFSIILPCLNDRKDAIAVATAKAWLKMNPGENLETSIKAGKNIGKIIRTAGAWYALVKTTLTAGAVIGDLGLEPILRQVIFRPSSDELKKYIAARKSSGSQMISLDPWSGGGLPAGAKEYDVSKVGIGCGLSKFSLKAGVYGCTTFAAPGQSWDVCVREPNGSRMACFEDFGPVRWSVIPSYQMLSGDRVYSFPGFPETLKLSDGKHCQLYPFPDPQRDASGRFVRIGQCDPYKSRLGDPGPDLNTYLWAQPGTVKSVFNRASWFGEPDRDGSQIIHVGSVSKPLTPMTILEGYFAPQ